MRINVQYLKSEIKNKGMVSIFFTEALVIIFLLCNFMFKNDIELGRFGTSGIFYFFIASTAIYIILFFIVTLYQLDFFHSKRKIDVYHSLPISRDSLFLTNILVVPILLMIPYFLMGMIIGSLDIVYDLYSNDAFRPYYYSLLFKTFVMTIFSYSIMVLTSTLTTNKLAHGIVTITTLIIPSVFFICIGIFFNNTINYGIDYEKSLIYTFMFFTSTREMSLGSINYVSIFLQILISIIFYVLAFFSYKNFKSENITKVITIKVIETAVISGLAFFISLFIVDILIEIGLCNIYLISLTFLGANYIFYMIFTKFIKKTVNFKSLSLFLGFSLIFLIIGFFDPFDFGSYAPRVSKVDHILINNEKISSEQYEKVKELQKSLDNDEFKDTLDVETKFYNLIEITYVTKEEKYISRYYSKGDLGFYDMLEDIIDFEGNKKCDINYLEDLKDEEKRFEYSHIGICLLGEYNQFENEFLGVPYNVLGANINQYNKELLECLILDIEEDEYYTSLAKSNMVIGKIEFVVNDSGIYKFSPFDIKSSYKNVLNFLYKEDINKMYEGKILATISSVEENEKLEEKAKDGLKYFENDHFQVLYGNNSFYTENDIYGNIILGDITTESLFQDIEEQEDVLEYTTISFDENPEEFLDYINNQIVYHEAEKVMPIEDGTAYNVFIFYNRMVEDGTEVVVDYLGSLYK